MADEPEIFPQPGDDDLDADILEDFDPDDDLGLTEEDPGLPRPYGFTWKFDFQKEDLDFSNGDPVKTDELGVVNEWISHTLNTELYESPAFDGDIGTPIFKMIGDNIDGYLMQRIKDEVVSAVNIHDRVVEVNNVYVLAARKGANKPTDRQQAGNGVYVFFTYATDDSLEIPALFDLR